MLRPAIVLAFVALLACLLVRCSHAQAAEPDLTVTPELRLGFHAQTPETHPWISHLMLPNVLEDTNAYLYLGRKWQLTPLSSLETLLGVGLATEGVTPAVSLRLERTSPKTYVWVDVEYAPTNHHNLYTYGTFAWRLNPYVMVGLDTEEWINLVRVEGQPVQGSWSVGPALGFKLGRDLFLAEALLWTGDAVVGRTYAHYWF